MSEYLLRQTGIKKYEIAKFDDTAESVDVYAIVNRKCSCPAFAANCKHIKIFKKWETDGKVLGTVYNDNAEIISYLPIQ